MVVKNNNNCDSIGSSPCSSEDEKDVVVTSYFLSRSSASLMGNAVNSLFSKGIILHLTKPLLTFSI